MRDACELLAAAIEQEADSPPAIHADAAGRENNPPMMPARWFADEFGVPPNRLRSARRRGVIRSEKRGSRWFYSARDAHRLWPDDVTYLPGKQVG